MVVSADYHFHLLQITFITEWNTVTLSFNI